MIGDDGHAEGERTEDGARSASDVGGVSGSVGASISDSQGPIHAGSGDQYVFYQETIREAVRRRRWVTDELERELEPRFVTPPGWAGARNVLLERRTVLLSGEPGSGRRSAALRLLGVCRESDSGHIYEVPWEHDEAGTQLLDPVEVAAGDRLLLDLSEAGEERFGAVQKELETFRGTVRERRALLVVVLPAPWRHLVRDEFQPLVVTLQRPDGLEVLRKHLEADGIRCAPGEIGSSPHAMKIAYLSIREIARFARLARQAREADASASMDDLLRRAHEALADRSADVAGWVKKHPSASARALLLATGMFAESPGDAVFEADRLLVDVLGFQLGELHDLQKPDLGSRLERVEAEFDARGHVRFASLNYAEAVRTHFWTHFPGLRDGFRDWVIACGGLPYADRRLVDRFAAQCLRVRRPEDLITATEAWATGGTSNGTLAEAALEIGLTDQRWGHRFRRQLYEWSQRRNLDPRLAYRIIVTCVGVLAGSWPGPAMVRLHHLTRHRDIGVAQAAEDALVQLAGDGMFLRRLLTRLNEEPYHRLQQERSRRLFLRVADPWRLTDATSRTRALIDDPAVCDELVLAWRSVFTCSERAEYETAVGQWLQAHAEGRGDRLIVVLVESCRAEIRLLAALFGCGRRWLEQARAVEGAARATVRRLEKAIDEAREPRTRHGLDGMEGERP